MVVVFSEMSQQLLDGLKCGADIHVPLTMSCNNSGDPLTFHPAPSSGQNNFKLSNTFVNDQMPAKLMAYRPASSVLDDEHYTSLT